MDDQRDHSKLQAQGWRQRDLPGFIGRVGPLWTRREAEGWAYGLVAANSHLNPAGLVHGGLLATLVDHALSVIAWEAAGRQPCVSIQLNTNFVAAAREAQFLEARGRVVRLTGGLVFMEGSVSSEGAPVITASSVMKLVRAP